MRDSLLDHYGNCPKSLRFAYQRRAADLCTRIRSRLSWVGWDCIPTSDHHLRGTVWRVVGAIHRGNHALCPGGHLVRPVFHGRLDHFLLVFFRFFLFIGFRLSVFF